MRHYWPSIAAGILCLAFTMTSHASTRIALVIGNSAYKDIPLGNPVNDAEDIANKLEGFGFNVTLVHNADQRQMKEAIRRFTRALTGDDKVGLFYYAGHGVEINGQNYLIPLNADIQVEDDVEFEAVNAGRLLTGMDSARNDLNMVVLDACRNNPFKRSFRVSAKL